MIGSERRILCAGDGIRNPHILFRNSSAFGHLLLEALRQRPWTFAQKRKGRGYRAARQRRTRKALGRRVPPRARFARVPQEPELVVRRAAAMNVGEPCRAD